MEGTDGIEKMSKSYGNHIGVMDKPEDMYGKALSIKDSMIRKWFALAADADQNIIKSVEEIRKSFHQSNGCEKRISAQNCSRTLLR